MTNSAESRYRVLGTYHPSVFDFNVIEGEVRGLLCLPACCRRERIGIRVPAPGAPDPPADNLAWHQDGSGPAGETRHMVVWASAMPTQLRTPEGEEFQGQPFELVWFDNFVLHHRQPTGTDETRRWFFAIRCSGA